MTHDFPSIEEVIDIHDSLIREFGGATGLRDVGASGFRYLAPADGVL